MTSTEKLVAALTAVHAPQALIDRATANEFNDYLSASATPCMDLIATLTGAALAAEDDSNKELAIALTGILDQAKEGAFDATIEESNTWAERMKTEDPEVYKVLQQMKIDKPIESK
jgi:hypothetical protein